MHNNIEIISVNYNTPDLIERMINSVRLYEEMYPIRIIDGSDNQEFINQDRIIQSKYPNVIFEEMGYNIHHGRGLDYGISTSKYEWCLLIDSDVYLKKPAFNLFDFDKLSIRPYKIYGWYNYINNNGFIDINGGMLTYSEQFPIKNYHGAFLLFNVDYYNHLKDIKKGFIHHGCPSVIMMKYFYDANIIDDVCYPSFTYREICDYINLKPGETRGTVNRFGYNLE